MFLLGVLKKIDLDDPSNTVVLPFARVGTGYSNDDLAILRRKLSPFWKIYDARTPPALFGRWKP